MAAIGSTALAQVHNQMMSGKALSGGGGGGGVQPGAGCVPAGHTWNLVIDDEFTKDNSLNTSIWNPFVFNSASGPITGYGGGAGVYEDGTGTHALSFSANGLQISHWNANGLSDNPNNYPGVGGISTKQDMGPGYYEAVVHPGSSHTAFWRNGNNGSCTAPNNTLNGPGGTEDDIQECFGPGTCGNNIHYAGYGACHVAVSGPQYTSSSGFDTYGMYWSSTTGKVFCHNGATIYTNTSANGPFAPPSPIIFDIEDGNGTDPMGAKYFRFWTDGGVSGGGIPCDVGPNYTGTIPAGASAAGFTHCLANYDFTSSVPFTIGVNTYNFSQINTWLDCKMSGGVPLWWITAAPSDVYNGTATSPCSDYAIVADAADGNKNALAVTYTPADVTAGSRSTQIRSSQVASISGTYPTATMNGQTIPQQRYVEWRLRFSTPDSNVNLNGTPSANAILGVPWSVSCCHWGGPYREDDWMESYTNIESGQYNDGLTFFPVQAQLSHPAFDHTIYHTMGRRDTMTSGGSTADCIYSGTTFGVDPPQIFNNGAENGSTTTGNCVTFSWTAANTLARQVMIIDSGTQNYTQASPPVILTGLITLNIEYIRIFTCANGNNGGSGSMNTGSCYTSSPITSNP